MPILPSLVAVSCLLASAHSMILPARASCTVDPGTTFEAAGLVPDIIPVFDPIASLGVTYFFNESIKSVELGTNFTQQQTMDRPIWSVNDSSLFSSDQQFVILMFDPDAPSPQQPNVSQIRHFVGGGFVMGTSTPFGTPLFNITPALSDYVSPGPPPNSDPHRYTSLLFKQPSDFPTTSNFSTATLADFEFFNATAFAEQTGLGDPIAGNFFTESNQPHVHKSDPGRTIRIAPRRRGHSNAC